MNENNLEIKDFGKDVVKYINSFQVMLEEDKKFLSENKERLQKVMLNTYMWRTDSQKRSIISDAYHPTIHSKFHQAILEQKVHFEQSILLAKDFEIKKLEVEELLLEIEEVENKQKNMGSDNSRGTLIYRQLENQKKKKEIELQYKQYELSQLQIAMTYRMKEIKGWKKLQDQLLEEMKKQNLTDEQIWNKEYGEVEFSFFQFLTNLQGLTKSTDGGEVNNLIALAKFGIDSAKNIGVYEKLKERCNKQQLEAISFIENHFNKN